MYTPRISKGSISNFQMQQPSTSPFDTEPTQQDLPGTEITYTCPASASKVAYEVKAQWYVGPDTPHSYFFVQMYEKIGSSGDYTSMGSGYRWTEIFQYLGGQSVMNCKILLPAYTGERSYKLRVKSYHAVARDATFHRDEAGDTFDPIVLMYAIM